MTERYQADGTIHVRLNDGPVTFIPDKYVEQGGCKFVVFVPWCPKLPEDTASTSNASESQSTREVEIDGLVVKTRGRRNLAEGVVLSADKGLTARLLEAAVKGIKVTVLVSRDGRKLRLSEVIVPAIPTKQSSA